MKFGIKKNSMMFHDNSFVWVDWGLIDLVKTMKNHDFYRQVE